MGYSLIAFVQNIPSEINKARDGDLYAYKIQVLNVGRNQYRYRRPLATEHHAGYSGLIVIPTLPFDLIWKKVLFGLEICCMF